MFFKLNFQALNHSQNLTKRIDNSSKLHNLNYKNLVKEWAVNSDFSVKHKCVGSEFDGATAVLFMNDDRVLVAKKVGSAIGAFEFQDVKCHQ